MSIRRSINLWCDHCGEIMDAGDLGNETAENARLEARMYGGHTGLPGGRDVCANCWGEGKR